MSKNEKLFSFSRQLKNQVVFKLNSKTIQFNVIIENDILLISIDEEYLNAVLGMFYKVRSDYVILDSMDMQFSAKLE